MPGVRQIFRCTGCCKAMRNAWLPVSCHQGIAGDSAFSLGMLAEFEGACGRAGLGGIHAFSGKLGLVGQVLYLEAEAAGVGGTGIGCYFDDPVHEIVGIGPDAAIALSLYHWWTGGRRAAADLAAYYHLQRG